MKFIRIVVLPLAILSCALAQGRPYSRVDSELGEGIWQMMHTTCANGTKLAPRIADILSTMTLEFHRNRIIQRAQTLVCEGTIVSNYRILGRRLFIFDGVEVIHCGGRSHRAVIARRTELFWLRQNRLIIREYARNNICGYGHHDIIYSFRKVRR